MIILGNERYVSQDYVTHKTAEDYSGGHKTPIKFYGSGKVTRVVNKYKSHEDSINYYDFTTNQYRYKDGSYYNCISITGKEVRFKNDELGGNCVVIESYFDGELYTLGTYHMDEVLVNVGDIIDSNTVVGYQGNTGLVASSKAKTDPTYGTHIHFEVKKNNTFVNPRDYAIGNKIGTYISQSNEKNTSVLQLGVLVDDIRIRESASISSLILGKVTAGDIYTVLDSSEDASYTWYKIKTNTGITGYIASSLTENWIEVYNPMNSEEKQEEGEKETSSLKEIFLCPKSDLYYIRLVEGETLYIKSN